MQLEYPVLMAGPYFVRDTQGSVTFKFGMGRIGFSRSSSVGVRMSVYVMSS